MFLKKVIFRLFPAAVFILFCIVLSCGKSERNTLPQGPYHGPNAAKVGRIVFSENPVAAVNNRCTDTQDYYRFLKSAAAYSKPVDLSEILLRRERRVPPSAAVSSADSALLGQSILFALNINFLIKEIQERPFQCVVRDAAVRRGIWRLDLQFVDAYAGRFQAVMMAPDASGPHPAILGLHGHSESGEIFLSVRRGEEFARRGYVILAPTFRANCSDDTESTMTRALLQNGFSMMSLRVYEALVCLNFLAQLRAVDENRIGLMGHSGGSSVGNLLIRVRPTIGAYVSDHRSEYDNARFMDDMAPDLWPLVQAVNDFKDAQVPVLSVEYDYKNTHDMKDVFSFFDDRLKRR